MDIREIELPGYQDSIRLRAWSDNYHAHYLLSGERFREESVILDLMMKYGGACTLHEKSFSATSIHCDYNCMKCEHSIYHEIETHRKRFNRQAEELIHRVPKERDEWELSIVMRNPRLPKYETLYWECKHTMRDIEVIQIIFDTVLLIDPTFFDDAQLMYTKIARFDVTKPMDVSPVANAWLHEKAKEQGHSVYKDEEAT